MEEAFRAWLTNRLEEIVEEAEEIKPVRLESPLTPRVFAIVTEEEASSGPAKWKAPAKEEEADEIRPPIRLERPVTPRVFAIVTEEEA